MENQHRKIKNYRELSQDEIDLMNEAKELEAQVLSFISRVRGKLNHDERLDTETKERIHEAGAHRWLAIGQTDIETGFMAITRSIAQPLKK